MRAIVSLLLLLAPLCFASQRTVLFRRDLHPPTWTRLGDANDNHEVVFFVALYQQNPEQIDQMLYEVSHPSSPKYGQHYTFDQIQDAIAPPKAHHDAVVC